MTVLIAILAFRAEIPQLASSIASRTKKVSAVNIVDVEFFEMREIAPRWLVQSTVDVRQLTPANIFDSHAATLFTQLRNDQAFDYAVVDLADGKQWLTSRLYIFAIMLERLRGLRCFVFLETTTQGRKQFLGIATPNNVRWALARRYPWLEHSFSAASAQVLLADIVSINGAIDPHQASFLVQTFIQQPDVQTASHPAPDNVEQWVQLGSKQLWEHAQWLDGPRLERDLSEALKESYVVKTASSELTTEEVVCQKGAFVALLEDGRRFSGLVDRHALLEEIAMRAENASAIESNGIGRPMSQEIKPLKRTQA